MKSRAFKLLKPLKSRSYVILIFLLTLKLIGQPLSFNQLGIGTNNYINTVAQSTVGGNMLYAGGGFTVAGGVSANRIAKWNGTSWSALGLGITGTMTPVVNALATFNNELYVGGYFSNAGGLTANSIAKWNGSSWAIVGTGVNYAIRDLIVYNGALYATGSFTTAGGVSANRIAKWNGTSWSALGLGLTGGASAYGICLGIYNNELYVAGSFTNAGGVAANGIAKWNGVSWSSVGTSPFASGKIYSMTVYNNELYAGGELSGCNIAKWNGSNWIGGTICAKPAPGNPGPGSVNSMIVSNNKLIIAGQFSIVAAGTSSAAVYYHVGSYDGVNANTYSLCYVNDLVNKLTVYNNQLIAGGIFTSNGVSPNNLNYIGACNLLLSGIHDYNIDQNYIIYPNPSTGQFTFEGLTETSSIEVTDLTGRIIFVEQMNEVKNSINLQGMQRGIYLYKIKNKQNKIQQGKLVLQ